MSSLMEGTKYAIARSYRQQGSHIKAFIVETKNIWKFDPKNPLQDYFLMQKQGNAIVMVAIQVLKVHGDRNVLEKEAADVVNDVDKPSRKKFLRRSYDQVQDKIIERDGNPSSESTTPQKRTDENRQKKKKAKSNKKEADPSLEEIFSFGRSMTNSDDPHTVNVAKEHQKRKEHMEQSSNLMLVPDLTSDKSARNFEKNQQEKRRVPVASTGIDCAENYEESPEMSEILSQEIANEESDGSNSKESQNLYIADQRDIVPHASTDDEQEKNKTQGKQLRDRLQGLNGLEEPPLRNNNNDHLRLIHLEKKVRTLEHDNGQLQLENSSLLRQIQRLRVYSDRLETELSELRNQHQETVQVSHAQMTAASTSSDSGCVVLSGDDLDRKEFVLGNEPFTKAQIDRWTKLEKRPRYTKFDMKHPVTGETIRMFHVALNINIPYEIWKQIKDCDPKTFLRNLTPGMWIIAKFANRCMLLVKTTVNPNPNSPRKFFTPRKRCAAEIAFKDQIDKKIPINKKKPEDSMLERAKMKSQFSVIMGDKVSQAQKDLRKLKGKFDDFIMKEIPVDAENPAKSKEKQAKIRDKFNSILEDPLIGQRQISLIKKKGFKKFFSIDLTSEESPSDHLTPQSNASNAPRPHQSTPPSRPSSRRSIPHLDLNDHDGTPRSLENAECNDNRPNLATPSRSGCTSATGAVQRSVFVPRQPIRCHLESLSSKESGTGALDLKHTSLARSKSQQGGMRHRPYETDCRSLPITPNGTPQHALFGENVVMIRVIGRKIHVG
ncbi:hypothetical protein QAD02_011349 [Eretmocerus hayati]|uniref:Uncharacterized protein n=1 Tax=Eretmocerus hayati TaxID=131215 RepID=A0ACC2NWH6_9HYME|nr:hypothetical protein QAD02_011349 [Eretmocerus hayati]